MGAKKKNRFRREQKVWYKKSKVNLKCWNLIRTVNSDQMVNICYYHPLILKPLSFESSPIYIYIYVSVIWTTTFLTTYGTTKI
jgi:hypothetical protein